MATVESILAAAMALPPEEQAVLSDRLSALVAGRAGAWPANLHPAWKDEIARRSAEPEDDDVSWEDVQRDMQDVIDQAARERAARGQS